MTILKVQFLSLLLFVFFLCSHDPTSSNLVIPWILSLLVAACLLSPAQENHNYSPRNPVSLHCGRPSTESPHENYLRNKSESAVLLNPLVIWVGAYFFSSFLLFFFFFQFHWSIVDIQCCDNFCCTTKRFSYTYTHIHSSLLLSLFFYSSLHFVVNT